MLQKLAGQVEDDEMTTGEVVQNYIMKATQEARCRYVDLLSAPQVGQPHFFITHAWQVSTGVSPVLHRPVHASCGSVAWIRG